MDIFTYLQGVCEFTVAGAFPERFLNLASRQNLGLWDVVRDGDVLRAKIIASRYKKALPIARKCQVKLHIKKKAGMPFKLIPHRKRGGMLLGFFLFFGIIWLLSRFIWFVDLPQDIPPEVSKKISAELEKSGIRPGTLRSRISGKAAAADIALSVPELSWAGVNVMGSWVTVDVRQMGAPQILLNDSTPCNLVATKPGVIIAIEAYDGIPTVELGQAVAQGDLLVSGVIDHNQGSVMIVHAWGKIMAHTEYDIKSEISFEQSRLERNGRVISMRRLMVLGIEIPLYFGKAPDGNFERVYDVWQPKVGKTGLPLVYRLEQWFELKQTHRIIGVDEAERLAREDSAKQIRGAGQLEITEYKEKLEITETGVILSIHIEAIEDISKQERIEFGD